MSKLSRRDEFNPNDRPVYRLVAPAVVNIRGATGPRSMPAGSIVEVDGLPDPWLEPMNSEARYRKYSAIRKAAQSVGWYSQAVLTAISLGAPAGSYEDAAKFVQDWMDSHRLKKGAAGHV